MKKDSDRIIQYLRKNYPLDYETCPEAHRHKTFFLDISELRKFFPDLKIFRAVQTKGCYMFTAPGTFHQGFNTGYNLASAVNFGTSHWLAEWKKIKNCLCMSNVWNSRSLLLAKKLEEDQAKQPMIQIKERVEEEEKKKFILQEKNPVKNCQISTRHFGSFRSGLYAVIAAKNDANFIFQSLSENPSKLATYILVPATEQIVEIEVDDYICQVYRVMKRTTSDSLEEIEKLKKKRKLNTADAHEEREISTFRTPRITSHRLIKKAPEYAKLLEFCLLMPIYSSSLQNATPGDEEKRKKEKKDPNSLYNLKVKSINSLILEKVCYKAQWTSTNLRLLSQITENISCPLPGESVVYEHNTISLLHSSSLDGTCQLALIDMDGIIKLDSSFAATAQNQKYFWSKTLDNFPLRPTVLCYNKEALINFFALDKLRASIHVVESTPGVYSEDEMKNALICKFNGREDLANLDLTSNLLKPYYF